MCGFCLCMVPRMQASTVVLACRLSSGISCFFLSAPPPQKIPAQLRCHLSLPLSCFTGATCLSCLKAPLSQSERTPLNYIWRQINSDAKWISLQKSTSGLSTFHFRVSLPSQDLFSSLWPQRCAHLHMRLQTLELRRANANKNSAFSVR